MTYDLQFPSLCSPYVLQIYVPPAVVRLGPWSIAGLGAEPAGRLNLRICAPRNPNLETSAPCARETVENSRVVACREGELTLT